MCSMRCASPCWSSDSNSDPAFTASRSDSRLAGRPFWRMKYFSPFGSVAVLTALSNGIVCRRSAGCATSPTDATSVAQQRARSCFFIGSLAERSAEAFALLRCVDLVARRRWPGDWSLVSRFLVRRLLGVLALGRLPLDAACILHQPGDLFRIADADVMRLAEPVRLARKADESRRHAAILQPLVIHHALTDRIGGVALAVQQQRRRRHLGDVGVRRLAAVIVGALPRRAADVPEPDV